MTTIDALFGSKTRVKLLHLFLNNPGKAFYVREITRLIDEQINSVRRELSNLLQVGVIASEASEAPDNKLYYEINQGYEFYLPFRAIFAGEKLKRTATAETNKSSRASELTPAAARWHQATQATPGLRLAIAAGALVRGSASEIDLLLVGSVSPVAVKKLVAVIEKEETKSVTFTTLPYEEFYYRLSVRDKFVSELLGHKHVVVTDVDNVLSQKNNDQ